MLPVTRANLDNICCTCLVNIGQPKDKKQEVYDVKNINLFNMLKLTAYIDLLKIPLNLKYIMDYCRKVCDVCFLNVKMAFQFRKKFIASIEKLKDVMETKSDTTELKYCCWICLKRLYIGRSNDEINKIVLKWVESFSCTDEIANKWLLIYNMELPKRMCPRCLEELENIEELQLLSTCSLEHIVSEISKNDNILKTHSNSINDLKCDDKSKSSCDPNESIVLKCDEEDTQYQETIYNNADLQINTETKDSQNEANIINATNSLVNEIDISQESTVDVENNDNGLSLFYVADSSNTDCNLMDDGFEKYKKQNINVNPLICGEHKKQKATENNQFKKRQIKVDKQSNRCHICLKYIKHKSSLKRHISLVHEGKKQFQCSHCPKKFGSKNSKRVHELIHTGEFPFVCDVCEKDFREFFKLKTHMKTHTNVPDKFIVNDIQGCYRI